MKYRPEIDGLRAVAVVPVILFHAGFGAFEGGFVGVDIFFVISGYLITSLLIEDIDKNEFSILSFYRRRARRILPALLFVLLCSLPFSWAWMFPDQLVGFGKSIVSVALFSSNVFFLLDSDYFSRSAEEKPLLHTWSLSVEEQFYIFFPFILLALLKHNREQSVKILIAASIASLAFSEWSWRHQPSANFYLLPTRAWELFAGAITAFQLKSNPDRRNDVLASIGLTSIILSIVFFDAGTPFPSFYALLPVIGTSLIIIYAKEGSLTSALLGNRALVGLGLISYSAYLWHQPLFAFARIRTLDDPSGQLMAFLSVTSLTLAWATWHFVEKPFRDKNNVFFSGLPILKVSSLGLALSLSIGILLIAGNGFENRLPNEAIKISKFRVGDTTKCHNKLIAEEIMSGAACLIGAEEGTSKVALLGDSHASRLTDALSDFLFSIDTAAVTYNFSWCAPFRKFASTYDTSKRCYESMTAAIDKVANDESIQSVILFAEWAIYTTGYRYGKTEEWPAVYLYSEEDALDWRGASLETNATNFQNALDSTLKTLRESSKEVIIVYPVPEYRQRVPDLLSKAILYDMDPAHLQLQGEEEYLTRSGAVISLIDDSAELYDADIVEVFPILCPDGICQLLDENSNSLYEDSNHISYYGALRLMEVLGPAIQDTLIP